MRGLTFAGGRQGRPCQCCIMQLSVPGLRLSECRTVEAHDCDERAGDGVIRSALKPQASPRCLLGLCGRWLPLRSIWANPRYPNCHMWVSCVQRINKIVILRIAFCVVCGSASHDPRSCSPTYLERGTSSRVPRKRHVFTPSVWPSEGLCV